MNEQVLIKLWQLILALAFAVAISALMTAASLGDDYEGTPDN